MLVYKVTIDGDRPEVATGGTPNDLGATVAYLLDCDHTIMIEMAKVEERPGDPPLSWGTLSDLIEPGDR